MWRGRAWMTVVRDLACLILPGAAFLFEALKRQPSVELLILYMALMTFPGLASGVFLARHGGGGIEPPSPPSPPELPPSPSPSSSSSASSGTDR